jgi:uncharacterized protein (DUF58 family)
VAGLFVALALVARGWSAMALRAVRCSLEFRDDRAFPDDEMDLILTIENRWLVPVAWLEADLTIPHRLYPLSGQIRRLAEPELRVIHVLATAMPLRRLTWRNRLRCRARGLYEIPHVWITVADPLRLSPRRIAMPVAARLIVYPRIVPLEQLGLRSRLPQGDVSLRSMLIDDPSRLIGVRDYRPGDPLRRVHWKASARRPQLQVKVVERTARLQLALYLGADGFDHPWMAYRDALFERAVTAAASLANVVVERGGRVSLAISGADPVSLSAGHGVGHLRTILEALAVVMPRRGRPLESVMAGSVARQQSGTTIVVLAAELTEEIEAQLRVARTQGHQITLLHAGLEPIGALRGVVIYELGRDPDVGQVLSGEG